jgi:amidase
MTSAFETATATATAEAIRTKQISAAELVELTFRQIDRLNPKLNAIIWQNRDAALARAKDADRALATGQAGGPLHGVPITIKESFAYRGSANTWGLPPLKDAISPRTAVAVERLEAAGAIVVGKTNVPVMLADWQTNNPIHGVSTNPWDVTRTPGGSTGGGAAAVAAGLGFLTLGSDLAGSIRIPAHFCGVYGHKPSLNLVSMAGFQPGPWDGSPGYPMDIAVVGPLARSAHDLTLALAVLGGPDAGDDLAWTWKKPAPRHTRLEDFRIGCVLEDPMAPVTADVAAVYERTVSAVERAGSTVTHGWPAGLDIPAQLKTFSLLLTALVNAENVVDPHIRWLQASQHRLAVRALWQTYFESHDVLLLPTTITAAFPHDHSEPIGKRTVDTPEGKRPYIQQVPYWITFASLAGIPATIAPVGFTRDGLPVGIQILGPMWEDATSIEFAALLADRIGGFTPPPQFAD